MNTQAKTGVEVERLPELPEPSAWGSLNVLTQKERIDKLPITALQPGVYQYRKFYDESAMRAYATEALAAERAEAVRVREALKELRSVVPYFWDDDSSHIGELDAACAKADEALK